MFLWNKEKCRGCFATCPRASSSWGSPRQLPQPPSAAPCPGSRNKQGASRNPPALQSVWSSGSPLVLTCLCARVCAHACTPVWERDVFVGSSFGIWFSTHFFVNFCHFSFSALISYQSSSLLWYPQTLTIFLVSSPSHSPSFHAGISFFFLFFFFTPVGSVQQAFSECWAPARCLG